MWTDRKLTQAADDIVWEGGDKEDAFPRARRLMYAAMQWAVTPFHVWEVHRWARGKADHRGVGGGARGGGRAGGAPPADRGAVQGGGAGDAGLAGHSMVCARKRAGRPTPP